MRSTILVVVAGLAAAGLAGCCHGGHGKQTYKKIELSKIAASPDGYAGKRVEVAGTLRNQGANYFTDLRLALVDGAGVSIPVAAWLPLEVPPPRPGGTRGRPKLVSDFLEKRVVLKGTWVKEGGDFILRVEEGILEGEGI